MVEYTINAAHFQNIDDLVNLSLVLKVSVFSEMYIVIIINNRADWNNRGVDGVEKLV